MSTDLPPEAFAASLAGLPMMTSRRLTWLLRRLGPEGAWAAVAAPGRHPAVTKLLGARYEKLGQRWVREAPRLAPQHTWARCSAAGVEVLMLGDDRYPMV